MDKILYCPTSFSTYNARFLEFQESDKVMIQKHKDILEVCQSFPLTIKVHPCDEAYNYEYFSGISHNFPNVKVIKGYWKWFLKAEDLVDRYQLVLLDIIGTSLVPVMAKRPEIPTIVYTRKLKLLRDKGQLGFKKVFHIVSTKEQLKNLTERFHYGNLISKEKECWQTKDLWFIKREAIQNWYDTVDKEIKFRNKYKTEFQAKDTENKWLKRLRRMIQPPRRR